MKVSVMLSDLAPISLACFAFRNQNLLGPPASAFFLLRPANAAAEWAFTDVVECILRLPQDEDPEENGRRKAMAGHLYLSSLSQTCSVTAGRLYRRRIQESIPGSSSPISEGNTNVEGGGINVWTGGYFVDLELHSHRRWSLGRYSSRFPPDITLTMDKFTGIARQHTYISVDPATRLAYLTALLPDMLTVDSVSPIYTPGALEPCRLALRAGISQITLGQLQYKFEYTEFSRTPQAQQILVKFSGIIQGYSLALKTFRLHQPPEVQLGR
jgi:hypothetical protein